MAETPIQLVCFDLGRVLIRICNTFADACFAADKPPPAELRSPETLENIGQWAIKEELGSLRPGQFTQEVGRIVRMTPEQVGLVWDAYLKGPYPGTIQLIDRVRQAGVKAACLTNTNQRHWRLMTKLDDPKYLLMYRLDYRFASHLIHSRKPDPAIYEYVERTTSIPPEGILFFDDVARHIEAAAERGWHAHLVEDHEQPAHQIGKILESYDM